MSELRAVVVGMGATGAVLAAALLNENRDVICVDPKPGLRDAFLRNGIRISGALSYEAHVMRVFESVQELKPLQPDVVFIATKTFHLRHVLKELKKVVTPETSLVSTHNGLGTEDVIAGEFGAHAAFRMSLNYGVSVTGLGSVEAAFFNRPNFLGGLKEENRDRGLRIAEMLTRGGLDTEFVDDIKLHVWRKMIHKCSLASICAVTDRTIREVLDFPPTREIADGCFKEALAVARAAGYDLGDDYIEKSMGYLDNVGSHKDSMCGDIANRTPTEIDFLGGKIVEYGRSLGVSTPFFATMTSLVKSMEDRYMKDR